MTEDAFCYPDERIASQCEWHAGEIERYRQREATSVVAQGRNLIAVLAILNESRPAFDRWVAWRLGCSARTADNYMRFAEFVEDNPWGTEIKSLRLAYKLPGLPRRVQKRICAESAFTEAQAQAVIDDDARAQWRSSMDEYLECGPPKDDDARMGDVLAWIEEAKDDDVLGDEAAQLYEKHREAFARLADRSPAEMDREVGIKPFTDADPARPCVTLDMAPYNLALCRWDGDTWEMVAQVEVAYRLGGDVLAAFPKVRNGPTSRAYRDAGVDALNAEYSIATGLYDEEVL